MINLYKRTFITRSDKHYRSMLPKLFFFDIFFTFIVHIHRMLGLLVIYNNIIQYNIMITYETFNILFY